MVGDGRRFVMQSRERFDVIEADALRPNSAYSGNLYSREYFELLRSRLTPGGLAVTWGADITDSAHVYGCFPARRGDPADVDRQQPADRHRR